MTAPVIHILDALTTDKIAAGEVVDRPASVVKELLENSLDAGASVIDIDIQAGGIELIQVRDNGCGMCPADATVAIKRHATSKIADIGDIYRLKTLGFRGEALSSIAAVSHFSLLTRERETTMAFYLALEGGRVTAQGETGGPIGTTVTVKDLFFNTPARRKFLKSPAAESSHIHAAVVKAALSHPHVAFKLFNNRRLVIQTPGTGDLREAIACLYGQEVAGNLLPLAEESHGININGYIAKPAMLRANRQYQTFIVNGRVVNNRFLSKSLDEAYHSLLPRAGYPIGVINIAIDAGRIDVNVHPQKSEVKFSEERAVFAAVYHAIRAALISPATPACYSAPLLPDHHEKTAMITAAAATTTPEGVCETPLAYTPRPFTLPAALTTITAAEAKHASATDNAAAMPQGLVLLGQVADTYVVASGGDDVFVFDQHAAHERIIYDHLRAQRGAVPVQELLIPIYLSCDAYEAETLRQNAPALCRVGINITETGPNTFCLSGLPVDIPATEGEAFIREVLQRIRGIDNPDEWRETVLRYTACHAAVKAGQHLSPAEMQSLVAELNATTLPYTCPHGRPTVLRLTAADLAKYFKRT